MCCRLTREVQEVAAGLPPAVRIEDLLDTPIEESPVTSQPQAVCELRVAAVTAAALHGAVLFMTRGGEWRGGSMGGGGGLQNSCVSRPSPASLKTPSYRVDRVISEKRSAENPILPTIVRPRSDRTPGYPKKAWCRKGGGDLGTVPIQIGSARETFDGVQTRRQSLCKSSCPKYPKNRKRPAQLRKHTSKAFSCCQRSC